MLRKPRANSDAIFQSYFGCSSPVENESVRDTVVVCDGLGTDNKLKKLKLKFGGVTHTIHTKLKVIYDLIYFLYCFHQRFSLCL